MNRYVPDAEIPVVLSEETKRRLLAKAKREHRLYLKGPIPIPWLCKAAGLSGKAVSVGLYLWWQAGMRKAHRNIKLNCSDLTRFGVGRNACCRCLSALERAGLVEVKRSQGKCPRVTIVKGGGKP